MKYLLWQFSAYAVVALALGVVVGRWMMAGRIATAERDRQRAAFELSSLTMKASALLEASGRERSDIVDANGRLADDLREAREAQLRIEADLRSAQETRARAEASLRAAEEGFAVRGPVGGAARADANVSRVAADLVVARAELQRVRDESAVALVQAEARAAAAERAHRELARVHGESVRAAQAELTKALIRAERAESAMLSRRAVSALATSPALHASAIAGMRARTTEPHAADRIVDLRPYDRVAEPAADGFAE